MSRVEDFVHGALNKIPGYTGYRDKENRRDEDKQVRDSVANAIVLEVDRLTAYNASLAAARDFSSISILESEVGQIRTLADRIRHASYGYGGIFTENSIDAAAIEQLRVFDAAMLREVSGLASAISSLTSSTPATPEAIKAVSTERNRLSTLFSGRNTVVSEGRPSKDEATLELLAIPEKVEVSPLLQTKRGDALSVLGDNFIANGVINLQTSAGEAILVRVSNEPSGATWLLGSSVPGVASARLTEGDGATGSTSELTSATAHIDTAQGQQKDVAARYSYTELGDNQVEFTLSLGDTIVTYTGTAVVNNDIEVYSVN